MAIGNLMNSLPFIRSTTDGGKTWSTALADTNILHGVGSWPASVIDISYKDTNLCIVTCDSNYYYRSTNSGLTWSKYYNDAVYHANQVKDIFINMYDDKIGCMTTPFELFLTEDGGLNWYKPTINLPDSLLPVVYINFYLINENSIVVIAYRKELSYYIIRSDDFGLTWKCFPTLPSNGPYSGGSFIRFINSDIGWMAGSRWRANSQYSNVIYHTTDGGYSWDIQLDSMPKPLRGLRHIYMNNDNNGIAFGPYNNIWRTTNGGKKWEIDSSFKDVSDEGYITDMAFTSHENIIAVTSQRKIYKYHSNKTGIYYDNFKTVSNNFEVYPNPATDYIEISVGRQLAVSEQSDVKIYNVLGEIQTTPSLRDTPPWKGGEIVKIDVSGLAPGMYFVRIGDKVRKFVKL